MVNFSKGKNIFIQFDKKTTFFPHLIFYKKSISLLNMRKIISIVIVSAIFVTVNAQKADSLYSYRHEGAFHTFCQVETKCTNEIANEIVNEFISQFRGDPNLLFEWAFKGIGKQNNEEHDEILLELKRTTFDPETNIGIIVTDIKIPGLRTFKNIEIESRVTKNTLPDGSTKINVDIFYSNALLKKAYGVYRIIPINDTTQLFDITISVKFSWFFDLFITKQRYCSIFEWRAKGFMENMRKEAERRQLLLNN